MVSRCPISRSYAPRSRTKRSKRIRKRTRKVKRRRCKGSKRQRACLQKTFFESTKQKFKGEKTATQSPFGNAIPSVTKINVFISPNAFSSNEPLTFTVEATWGVHTFFFPEQCAQGWDVSALCQEIVRKVIDGASAFNAKP
ncbi:uncharacterized protein BJX67DRAFT_320194 [Aspergillus lucknowensis]|uniref:Uncharacterized protein n=1 Tax=Aspergillus lucknowensis TaxID=176173 RepID=A0ABR4LYV6_9EURO